MNGKQQRGSLSQRESMARGRKGVQTSRAEAERERRERWPLTLTAMCWTVCVEELDPKASALWKVLVCHRQHVTQMKGYTDILLFVFILHKLVSPHGPSEFWANCAPMTLKLGKGQQCSVLRLRWGYRSDISVRHTMKYWGRIITVHITALVKSASGVKVFDVEKKNI